MSRTRSKFCDSRSKSLFSLFRSTLECHTLLYQEVVPSLMTYLMKWCSYLSLSIYLRAVRARECWGCISLWWSNILKQLILFWNPKTLAALLAWLVIISSSWVVCVAKSIRSGAPSVNELDSCRNSQDHIFSWKASSLSQLVTFVTMDPNEVPLSPRDTSQVGHACADCCEMVGCCLQFSRYVMCATVRPVVE